MDGQAVGRMVPSLPYIDGTPVDGGLRVRLTTARAVLEVGEDVMTLSAAGSTFEFAPAAEAVLRPLVDGRTVDLAALADTAGLALAQHTYCCPALKMPTKAAFTMPTGCDGEGPPVGILAGRSSARCRFLRRSAGGSARGSARAPIAQAAMPAAA